MPGNVGAGAVQSARGSHVAETAIAYARAQIGKPYRWGATGPNAYDCSGLVQAAYKSAGKALPRTTGLMINAGTNVSRDQLAPGDLVFPDPGHVQIYTGNGMVVEAPHTGLAVREVAMWGFWRARRVAVPASGTADIGGAVGAVGGALHQLDPLHGIEDNIGNIVGALGTVAKVVAFLTNPANGIRALTFLVGIVLIGIALDKALNAGNLVNSAANVARTVGKVKT